MRYERKSIGAHRQISHQVMPLSILLFLVFTTAGAFTAGAQIAVVPDQGAQSGHPFQLPFEIENSSFPLHIQRVFLYVRQFRVHRTRVLHLLESPKAWMNLELEPGASEVFYSHLLESEILPDEVDIVVAIDARSSDYLSSVDRQYFHFVGYGDSDRDWTWISEPSESVRAEVDYAAWITTKRGVRGAETK